MEAFMLNLDLPYPLPPAGNISLVHATTGYYNHTVESLRAVPVPDAAITAAGGVIIPVTVLPS
jgi:hypothetical protein